MKALSIKGPWAGLIVPGQKIVALRIWKTFYRKKLYGRKKAQALDHVSCKSRLGLWAPPEAMEEVNRSVSKL